MARHEQRLEKLSRLLVRPRSLDGVTAELFAGLETGEDRMLASLEAFAHLEHLRVRGTVAATGGQPVRWVANPAAEMATTG